MQQPSSSKENTMPCGYPEQYDEIDLADLFRTLWRGRWFIAGVTIFAMLVSGFVSFFVLKPVYEAKALILISRPQKTPQNVDEKIRDVIAKYEFGATIETFQQQILSQDLLLRVLAKSGVDQDVDSFRTKVKATILKGTNLIEISVRDNEPDRASSLANAVVEEYVAFLSRLSQDEITKTADAIKQQIAGAAENLRLVTTEYEQFLKKGRSSAELKEEMSIRTQVLAQYRGELMKAEVEYQALQASVDEYERELKNHPRVLVTTRSILDEPLMRDLAANGNTGDAVNVGLSVKSEEVNSTFVELTTGLAMRKVRLAETVARRKAISEAIERIESEMEALRIELSRRQVEEDQILYRLNSSKEQLSLLSSRYDEARLGEGLDIGQVAVHIVSPAVAPGRPVAPRKALNVAVAGGCLG